MSTAIAQVARWSLRGWSTGALGARWQLLRGSALLLAATAAGSLLNVGYTFVAARLLVPAQYGELIAVMSIAGVVGAPAATLQVIVARYGALAVAEGTLGAFRTTMRSLLWTLSAAAVLLTGAGLLAAGKVAAFLHLAEPTSVLWAAVLIGCALVLPAMRGAIQGFCRFGTLALLSTTDIVFKVTVGLGLVAAGFGAAGATAGLAGAALAGIALSWRALRWFFALPPQPSRTGAAMLRFAAPAFFTSGGLMAMVLLDTVLAPHYLAPDEAGMYASVAVAGRSLFWLSGAVALAILPLGAQDRRGDHASLLWPGLLLAGGVALCGVLTFHLVPDLLVRLLFGVRYGGGAGLLPMYGWAALLLSLVNVMANYLMGQGRSAAAFPILAGIGTFAGSSALFHGGASQLIANLIVAGLVTCAGLVLVVRFGSGRGEAAARPAATSVAG